MDVTRQELIDELKAVRGFVKVCQQRIENENNGAYVKRIAFLRERIVALGQEVDRLNAKRTAVRNGLVAKQLRGARKKEILLTALCREFVWREGLSSRAVKTKKDLQSATGFSWKWLGAMIAATVAGNEQKQNDLVRRLAESAK